MGKLARVPYIQYIHSRDIFIVFFHVFIYIYSSFLARNYRQLFIFICQVMKERTNYLILVLCEDVSSEDLDDEMRIYLRTNTYLRRDSRWFWEKLRYAMPQTPLVKLQEGLNILPNPEWSGLYALARAQRAESLQMAADQEEECNHHQYRRQIQQEGVIQGGAGGSLPQTRGDMPLVEYAWIKLTAVMYIWQCCAVSYIENHFHYDWPPVPAWLVVEKFSCCRSVLATDLGRHILASEIRDPVLYWLSTHWN